MRRVINLWALTLEEIVMGERTNDGCAGEGDEKVGERRGLTRSWRGRWSCSCTIAMTLSRSCGS